MRKIIVTPNGIIAELTLAKWTGLDMQSFSINNLLIVDSIGFVGPAQVVNTSMTAE